MSQPSSTVKISARSASRVNGPVFERKTPFDPHSKSRRRPGGPSRKVIFAPGDELACVIRKMASTHLVETKIERKDLHPSMSDPSPQYALSSTAVPALRAMGRLLAPEGKVYRFMLPTALTMSSSGAGIINSLINTSTIASNADFVSLSSVFSEFFVVAMHLKWQPISRYNGPIGFASATNAGSLPIGLCSLHHGTAAYTSLSSMSNNQHFDYQATGDPFAYRWLNIEDPKDKSVIATGSETNSFQGWGLCSLASQLTGNVQIISLPAPPALPVSVVTGCFIVAYEVLMRYRE